jgi:hypothetical protein
MPMYEFEIKILEYTIIAIYWLYYRSMTVIYIINKKLRIDA